MKKAILSGISSIVGDFLLGGAKSKLSSTVDEIKEKAEEFIEDAQIRITVLMQELIKKTVNLFLIFLGVIFGLVGVAMYLSTHVDAFAGGVGYIVVGVFILLLAWLAKHVEFK